MNTKKPDKEKVLEKIRFLEARLVSLDFYLPETYQYLLAELEVQRCILAELEVEDAFASIDQTENRTGDPYLMVRFLKPGVPLSSVATHPLQTHEPDLDTGWTSTGDSGADGDASPGTPQVHGDDPGPSQDRSRDRARKPLST